MILGVEKQEEGVAAELEEGSAPLGDDLQHVAEDLVEDDGQLLGADPALTGETL